MIEFEDQIRNWLDQGQRVLLATVVKTWGSSPRQAGSNMAVSEEQKIAGSVSGGCVEGAVVDAGLEVLKSGRSKLLHFGVTDDRAWEVGLACGGEIEVFIREVDRTWLERRVEFRHSGNHFCEFVCLDGPGDWLGKSWIISAEGDLRGKTPPGLVFEKLGAAAEKAIRQKQSFSTELSSADPAGSTRWRIFVELVQPPPVLILVGGGHIAVPLTEIAAVMGFETVVIDPRRLFSDSDRFSAGVKIYGKWPEEAFSKIKITSSTAVVMLTHDPKIDDPALKISLKSNAFYVGALGSNKTHRKRLERLEKDGVPSQVLEKIFAPVGLNLGDRTAEGIALSIMAEILQVKNLPHHSFE
jgi:xanthine dehydrogenase accessory factor